MFPDTQINVKAGLQSIKLPGVFGNPVFDDDAAALVVSAPINDMFGVAVGYTRGSDRYDNIDNAYDAKNNPIPYLNKDDMDMAFLAVPVKIDGFAITPYFAYAWIGKNVSFTGQQGLLNANKDRWTLGTDDSTVWVLGANAALTMFAPLTFAADLIYGEGENDDYETKGWYTALAASYKFDMLTATLFSTYATGADDKFNDAGNPKDDNYLPTLAENWTLTPYLGGARAFNTGKSNAGFATDTLGVGRDGTGLWTIGLTLDKITFIDKLSHRLTIAYAEGTSDKNANEAFDEKDSAWEVYFVNKYMLYENLAAINELGYFAPNLKGVSSEDDSYFATIGFQYNF
jgi:hypothetical protein